MKKRTLMLLLCLLLAVLLTGCGELPPAALRKDTPDGQTPLAAEPEAGNAQSDTATLYFRYEDTALLRQETREITLTPNETREKALVNALIEGSHESGGSMLFPENTQVLSTQTQDGMIYVTFNEALYDRYSDEGSLSSDSAYQSAILRRRLAMAALCATLTENGEYHAVQVLVRAESNVSASMRLRESYFLSDSDLPCEPLTREEAYLPTPAASAQGALRAWQTRDWETLSQFLLQRGASQQESEQLRDAQVLLDYTVGTGCVSPDGQSAVICVDITLRTEGGQQQYTAWPLRMTRENGVWKAAVADMAALMQIVK